MLDYVSGKLVKKKPTYAVIDVQGLGYRLLIPTSTFEHLPDTGQQVHLVAYQSVREDDITLYGFGTEAERDLFEVMMGVSGIGPKLALAALSALRPQELRDYVVHGETAMLTSIPGVGRKTAERIVVELRDRLSEMDLADTDAAPAGDEEERAAARADALAALVELGMSRAAAERAIRKALRAESKPTTADGLVRHALRHR